MTSWRVSRDFVCEFLTQDTSDSHAVGAAYSTAAETQRIVLVGVNLQSLYSGATTDAQIITQLLNNNKLIVD